MNSFRRTLSLLVFPALLLLGACEESPADANAPGTFTVLLTDAPGDFETAVVTIESIYLQGSEGEGDESGRVVLMEESETVSLLDLQNKALELVEGVVVDAGVYSQLRMVISGGYIEVEQAEGPNKIYASSPDYTGLPEGVTPDGHLQMPSFAQSGLKINLPGGAVRVDGDQTILLLDFNVKESFGKQAGQSGKWVMTPVIHASDFTMTGGVEFTLALGEDVNLPPVNGTDITLADFAVELDKGDVLEEAFDDSDGDGIFTSRFRFLVPGDYPVSFVEPAGVDITLDPVFPGSVTVTSGQTTSESLTITEAVLEAASST